jgi:DNA repair protein RadC
MHTANDLLLRPRERLLARGPEALSDRELISILLGWGIRGRHVDTVAEDVVAAIDRRGAELEIRDLEAIPGLGEAKITLVLAAFEIARRVLCPTRHRIAFPGDVVPLISHYADRKQEHFLALPLNGAHEVIACRVVSVGLVNRALVHPREIFAEAIVDRAAAIIVAHNHPSGNIEPSPEDREVTRRLYAAGETLGVSLLDHVIFSQNGYFSFLEHDLLGK